MKPIYETATQMGCDNASSSIELRQQLAALAQKVAAQEKAIQALTTNLVDVQDSNGTTSFRAFRV